MASVNGVNSSSYSSIYGSRGSHIVSGLASGLDTEAMIENSVKGYQAKIQDLMNQQTKLTWKQDAVRKITDQLIALSEKYTSYTSKTNLFSNAFFNNAIKTLTGGKYADKIAATGRTNSDIKINSVEQMATAARYQVDLHDLGLYKLDTTKAEAASAIDTADKQVSDITGTMTVKLGGKSFSLTFGKDDIVSDTSSLADKITEKLKEEINKNAENGEITIEGNKYDVNEALGKIHVNTNGNEITLSLDSGAFGGAAIYIDSASGKLAGGAEDSPLTVATGMGKSSITVNDPAGFSHTETAAQRLSNQRVRITLDGETTEIALGDYGENMAPDELRSKVLADLQKGLEENFGNKITASMDASGKLSFNLSEGSASSTLKVTSEAGETLGIGAAGVTSYLNTGKTLGELLGTEADSEHGALKGMTALDAVGEVKVSEEDAAKGTDKDGNSVIKIGDDWKRVDEKGNLVYAMNINGKQVGAFTKDTALESVFTAINNSDAGVKVSYSQLSSKLTFTSTKTGAQSKVEFGDEMSKKLFGGTEIKKASNGLLAGEDGKAISGTDDQGNTYFVRQLNDGRFVRANNIGRPIMGDDNQYITVDSTDPVVQKSMGYTAGQDAIVNIDVNGENKTLTRSSNVIDMDGMSVTLKGTFNEGYDPDAGTVFAKDSEGNFILDEDGNRTTTKMTESSQVTFTNQTDADTVVDAIKSFVEQINALMKDVHDAYSTMPLSTTSGSSYEPLSDEAKADLSENELKAYEEKAKTGLLFGDRDLNRLYDSLRKVISSSGMDVAELRDIGLTTTYESGLTTLTLNEDKLRDALTSDPDKVRQAFTKTVENGSSTNGLMYNLKKVTDQYASTSIGAYGILVKKAGTKIKPLTLNDNSLQKQINSYEKQIENWKLKMSDRIDYYTRQFSMLEQLMNQMNSQSSALAGLMGGG